MDQISISSTQTNLYLTDTTSPDHAQADTLSEQSSGIGRTHAAADAVFRCENLLTCIATAMLERPSCSEPPRGAAWKNFRAVNRLFRDVSHSRAVVEALTGYSVPRRVILADQEALHCLRLQSNFAAGRYAHRAFVIDPSSKCRLLRSTSLHLGWQAADKTWHLADLTRPGASWHLPGSLGKDLKLSHDGSRCAYQDDSSAQVHVWDLSKKAPTQHGVVPLVFSERYFLSANGDTLACGEGEALRLWDLTQAPVLDPNALPKPSASWTLDMALDASLSALSPERQQLVNFLQRCRQQGGTLRWRRNVDWNGSKTCLSWTRNEICMWDLSASSDALPAFTLQIRGVCKAVSFGDQAHVFVWRWPQTCSVWNVEKKPAQETHWTKAFPLHLEVSPDGARAAYVGDDFRLRVVDLYSSSETHWGRETVLAHRDGAQWDLAFISNSQLLGILAGKSVHLWDFSAAHATVHRPCWPASPAITSSKDMKAMVDWLRSVRRIGATF